MYPKGRMDEKGQKTRGKICKLCDRKFMVKQMIFESQVAITKMKPFIKNLENRLEEQKRDNIDLRNSRDQDRYRLEHKVGDLNEEITRLH